MAATPTAESDFSSQGSAALSGPDCNQRVCLGPRQVMHCCRPAKALPASTAQAQLRLCHRRREKIEYSSRSNESIGRGAEEQKQGKTWPITSANNSCVPAFQFSCITVDCCRLSSGRISLILSKKRERKEKKGPWSVGNWLTNRVGSKEDVTFLAVVERI